MSACTTLWNQYAAFTKLTISRRCQIESHTQLVGWGGGGGGWGNYFISSIMVAGFSRYDFHWLENLAMVAPSMTL